ncbi:unnamed protein product [Moneuplotes crassus]|uniref:Uncharacterized protein n=1 Tax=Euplotes crassus TaxID=5936 RepID=A0AAD2D0S6_EUPCR|nr:unnamed protein product [Moneuplotes crassus]
MEAEEDKKDDIFTEIDEEIKNFGSIKKEKGILDIDSYQFINDLLMKYTEIKEYQDRAEHRKTRRSLADNKEAYKQEVARFMDVEMKAHVTVLGYICNKSDVSSKEYALSQMVQEPELAKLDKIEPKVTPFEIPCPKVSKEHAQKALKEIERLRMTKELETSILVNDEHSSKLKDLMKPKVIEIPNDEDEGEESEEEEESESEEDENKPAKSDFDNYSVSFDGMVDRLISDNLIQDKVYEQYKIEEEDAIRILSQAEEGN